MAYEYKKIFAPSHPRCNYQGYVCEHILVAEQLLGRMLTEQEVVHHIDGNRKNNDPTNLIVFATKGDHSAHHKGCKIYKENDVWKAVRKTFICSNCGKEFIANPSLKDEHNHFCSKECRMKGKRKFPISDANELKKLLFSANGNFTALAKNYNVNANAIVRRCKILNIPYHSSDYRKRQ